MRKKKTRRTRRKKRSLWSRLDRRHMRQVGSVLAIALFAFLLAGGAAFAVIRLDERVDELLLAQYPQPVFDFADLPEDLQPLASYDLENAIAPFRSVEWTAPELCEQIATKLAEVPWIERLDYVRRRAGGRFEIRASYRQPLAMVQDGSSFALVDRDGFRLPGTYMYDPAWKLVQGVEKHAPAPGQNWNAPDLKAGLELVEALQREPFANQITAVLVDNFGGREDRRSVHLELATDRPGGRVRWGSAIGAEVEENTVRQKTRLMRENYRKTGRVDAGYPIIDVSTYPDRFIVPK